MANFPELHFLERLLENLSSHARVNSETYVDFAGKKFPIYSVVFGSKDPTAPTLALIGGVHGQEKIGSQVVLSYLEILTELLHWDEITHKILEKSRIVFLPIVNPIGMYLIQRTNANGVDIMRNSPITSNEATTFLVGGQRISRYLPWYQGPKGGPMEIESQALCSFIQREVYPAKVSIALDVHSGYGAVDRLWFLYAKTKKPYPELPEAYALKVLLDQTYSNHVYRIEPSAQSYTISGDIWDYLYDEQKKSAYTKNMFMPFTLEMGSWLWLKKNPIQLFSAMGLFHPVHLHRHKRILRRHITLLDFLHRAVISSERWAFLNEEEKNLLRKEAIEEWYS